uniref:Uncharacterized protein n=1 Tax=Candidatus Berkiella aquae TaxID=295108 RepID=A0A0Q9YM70_9GAMM
MPSHQPVLLCCSQASGLLFQNKRAENDLIK